MPKNKSEGRVGGRRRQRRAGQAVVTAPLSQGVQTGRRYPQVMPGATGTVTVRHEELFVVLPPVPQTGTEDFVRGAVRFGPSILPVLKGHASLYSKYKINNIRITYRPTLGAYAAGAVALGVFTDPTDVAGLAQLNGEGAFNALESCPLGMTTPVWCTGSFTVPGARLHSMLNYFTVGVPNILSPESLRLQVPFQLGYAVHDPMRAGLAPGRVHVEYDVTFVDPISPAIGGLLALPREAAEVDMGDPVPMEVDPVMAAPCRARDDGGPGGAEKDTGTDTGETANQVELVFWSYPALSSPTGNPYHLMQRIENLNSVVYTVMDKLQKKGLSTVELCAVGSLFHHCMQTYLQCYRGITQTASGLAALVVNPVNRVLLNYDLEIQISNT